MQKWETKEQRTKLQGTKRGGIVKFASFLDNWIASHKHVKAKQNKNPIKL